MYPEDYWRKRETDVEYKEITSADDPAPQSIIYDELAHQIVSLNVPKVTDIGCNVGILGLFLHRAGFTGKYVGIDSNPFCLPLAKHNLESTGMSFEIEEGNLRFPPRRYIYNCVVIKDVLEHLESIHFLKIAFEVTVKYLIVASSIPWVKGETCIEQAQGGFYMNHYGWPDVLAIAKECSFELQNVQLLRDGRKRDHQIVFFERVKKQS